MNDTLSYRYLFISRNYSQKRRVVFLSFHSYLFFFLFTFCMKEINKLKTTIASCNQIKTGANCWTTLRNVTSKQAFSPIAVEIIKSPLPFLYQGKSTTFVSPPLVFFHSIFYPLFIKFPLEWDYIVHFVMNKSKTSSDTL